MSEFYVPTVSRSIKAILDDEDWFSDGHPRWHGQQSVDEVGTEKKRRISVLIRMSRGRVYWRNLASILERCDPESRCGSGACALCGRAVQRWYVAAVCETINEHPQGEPVMLSAVSHRGNRPAIGVSHPDVINIGSYFTRKFVEAGIPWLAGALDVRHYAGSDPYLCIHAHALAVIKNPDLTAKRLSDILRRDGHVSHEKHVVWKPWDGSTYGASYAMKYRFHDVRASDEVKARLMLAFHVMGLDRRMILRGVRRRLVNGFVSLNTLFPWQQKSGFRM